MWGFKLFIFHFSVKMCKWYNVQPYDESYTVEPKQNARQCTHSEAMQEVDTAKYIEPIK